jgi:biotin carboxyl carrier protein
VEVDGDIFKVRITPLAGVPLSSEPLDSAPGGGAAEIVEPAERETAKKLPEGAVVCEMAGLVLSVDVKPGDRVEKGDPVAMIEAMKMRRPVPSTRSGTVRAILVHEGEIVEAGSVLLVVAET